MGLTATLATAGRTLEVFTMGIEVAGQNIANAGTPGYIREELLLETNSPYPQGGLLFGTGVSPLGVQQQIDTFLETRIHSANTSAESAQATELIYKQLESEIRELGDGDLSTALNDFLGAIDDAVSQPDSNAMREIVIQEGERLASDIVDLRTRIDELRASQTVKVESLVAEANQLIDQIAELNPQITKLEAGGLLDSDAGGLRSQRYEALNRLSEIVPTRFREREDGSTDVFIGSDFLILGGQSQNLELLTSVDRDVQIHLVQTTSTNSDVSTLGGELKGVIDGRDTVVGGFVDELDLYVSNLIFEFNKIHASGEGLIGFETLTSESTVLDTTADLDDPAAGLQFTPTHGNFDLKVTNSQTGITTTTNIAIDLDGIGADTGLDDLQAALDAITNLSASITTDGRLQIDSASGYEFSFANDTSGALAALGLNTFFTGGGAQDIGVNSQILGDHRYFASSLGGGPSDNSNAVRMAQFLDNPISALGNSTLDEFYNTLISDLAQNSASQTVIAEGRSGFRNSLLGQREQFTGVSLDEEAIKVLQFQRGFQSAARLISVIDELFTTLLSSV